MRCQDDTAPPPGPRRPSVLQSTYASTFRIAPCTCAFVTLKPVQADGNSQADDPMPLTETEVIEYCRDNMAHFKCPTSVVFADLPKTLTGKVQKHVLRSMVE